MAVLSSVTIGACPAAAAGAGQPGSNYAASVREGVEAASHNDYATAVKLWQGPAAAGDADAQFNLGMAYKNGLGVTADLARAEDLFHKAALQGHVDGADQYGLLLFQTGHRREALPWLEIAAEHGEERAQYVLGTAHYNGDFVPKDWITAYALMSSAAGQGLLQAKSSLTMMDQTIPLEQRQQGIALALDMQKKAASLRGSQLAAADLGAPRVSAAPAITAAPVPPSRAQADDTPPPPRPTAATAGASYASAPPSPPRVRPIPRLPTPPAPKPAQVAAPAPATGDGRWRVQLGAFGQPANANALWARASARAELAGKRRIDVKGTTITRLQAGGFASEAAANHACAGLRAAGFVCVVVNP